MNNTSNEYIHIYNIFFARQSFEGNKEVGEWINFFLIGSIEYHY